MLANMFSFKCLKLCTILFLPRECVYAYLLPAILKQGVFASAASVMVCKTCKSLQIAVNIYENLKMPNSATKWGQNSVNFTFEKGTAFGGIYRSSSDRCSIAFTFAALQLWLEKNKRNYCFI